MLGIDPIILLLTALVVFFTILAFAAEKFFASDAVFFSMISGILTTVLGALMLRIRPKEPSDTKPDPTSSKTTATVTTVEEIRPPQNPQ